MKLLLQCILILQCIYFANASEPVWDANKVDLVSEELSPNVYAVYSSEAKAKQSQGIPVATSGGFIVGENAVLLIETMLNKRLHAQVQKLIKNITDKPIVYAVNTSYHGDHSYGNMYLPEQTIIIQHQQSKEYIDTHFQTDTQFMIQNFGQGRGIEEILPVTGDILIPDNGKIKLDLGKLSVDIIDFGFAQTGGDLFIFEPVSKVMWTGNPVISKGPSLPWLLDGHLLETLETLKVVYAFLPADARIVPGHGSVMKRQDLVWHIDYLETIKKQVESAIKEGLSLEATVERVKMPEFSGYQLFDWVHPGLNVPAAFNDLSNSN